MNNLRRYRIKLGFTNSATVTSKGNCKGYHTKAYSAENSATIVSTSGNLDKNFTKFNDEIADLNKKFTKLNDEVADLDKKLQSNMKQLVFITSAHTGIVISILFTIFR